MPPEDRRSSCHHRRRCRHPPDGPADDTHHDCDVIGARDHRGDGDEDVDDECARGRGDRRGTTTSTTGRRGERRMRTTALRCNCNFGPTVLALLAILAAGGGRGRGHCVAFRQLPVRLSSSSPAVPRALPLPLPLPREEGRRRRKRQHRNAFDRTLGPFLSSHGAGGKGVGGTAIGGGVNGYHDHHGDAYRETTSPSFPSRRRGPDVDDAPSAADDGEDGLLRRMLLLGIRGRGEGQGGVFATREILHPSLVPDGDNDNDDDEGGVNERDGEDEVGIPLHFAIDELRRSLLRLLRISSSSTSSATEGGGSLGEESTGGGFGGGGTAATGTTARTVRIERVVDHPVDPLCWLRAQRDGGDGVVGGPSSPRVYLADAEGTLEAAGVGSAWTLRGLGTGPGGGGGGSGTGGPSRGEWDGVSRLPPGIRAYGGGRFDPSWSSWAAGTAGAGAGGAGSGPDGRPRQRRNDWVDEGDDAGFDDRGGDGDGGFANGYYYVVPSVELRRERVVPGGGGGREGRWRTTVAVNVRFDVAAADGRKNPALGMGMVNGDAAPSSSGIGSGRSINGASAAATPAPGLRDAVRSALSCLDAVTGDFYPPEPPSTLPSVLRRAEDESESSQERWEEGVDAVLDAIGGLGGGGGGGDGDGDQGEGDDGGRLRKVVLARRETIHLGGDVHPLDLLRTIKFGGGAGGGAAAGGGGTGGGVDATGGGSPSRHLFFLQPAGSGPGGRGGGGVQKSFLGCTPERLFRIDVDGTVQSEALAGTRIRGEDATSDRILLEELMSSPKDMAENDITESYIEERFRRLVDRGLLTAAVDGGVMAGEPFVRRLRHLQHICRRMSASLTKETRVADAARHLLDSLHPTPAVGGSPLRGAIDLIRSCESFDRGFYAGPFGYLASDSVDILVGIRSALLSREMTTDGSYSRASVSIYAGAGIVPGSTPQGEWAETSHKLSVLSSLFTPSPLTLRDLPTANSAWAAAFIEELVRCGVTEFVICPGSRSTPLTAAVVKASRRHAVVGSMRLTSVHDERGAGFRAVGYARRSGRPAVVITSSGTAVGNLLPSIMEADNDGLPLLVLTADRPYESRDVGANQALDQVKVFGTHVRWFRDIPPPTDDVPVNVALSDANHAVSIALKNQGPVHLNVQFRENLAPDVGPIRGDARSKAVANFDVEHFTNVPRFGRWAGNGQRWQFSYPLAAQYQAAHAETVQDVAHLIASSRRGVIVVGNIRDAGGNDGLETAATISHAAQQIGFPIMAGAQSGAAALRWTSPTIVPFSDHVLKHPDVAGNVSPDLILQVGAPLVSTEVQKMILSSMTKEGNGDRDTGRQAAHHVLIHPHHPTERADPNFTVTHRVSVAAGPFLKAVLNELGHMGVLPHCSSQLSALIPVGRALQKAMPEIIHEASRKVVAMRKQHDSSDDNLDDEYAFPSKLSSAATLTEPQVMLAISEVISSTVTENGSSDGVAKFDSFFFSNSMPIRDAEAFFYNHAAVNAKSNHRWPKSGPRTAVNRGASGIDGVISSASGFAAAGPRGSGTTLVVGDLASLHDINALHTLGRGGKKAAPDNPLTAVIVNNNGGGIFSFLPIAKHGSDVGFEDYFGTPTESVSFSRAAAAFGLDFASASTYSDFKALYSEALGMGERKNAVLEAQVVGREENVAVHGLVAKLAVDAVSDFLKGPSDGHRVSSSEHNLPLASVAPLPLSVHGCGGNKRRVVSSRNVEDLDISGDKVGGLHGAKKTLLLLHGWMGDRADWKDTLAALTDRLSAEWQICVVDLPGHGQSPTIFSHHSRVVVESLGLDDWMLSQEGGDSEKHRDEVMFDDFMPVGKAAENMGVSLDWMAQSVLATLEHHGIDHLDAVCGYSLGGRVAMTMQRLSSSALQTKQDAAQGKSSQDKNSTEFLSNVMSDKTKLILVSASPGNLPRQNLPSDLSGQKRAKKDDALATSIMTIRSRERTQYITRSVSDSLWVGFLKKWYGAPIWGGLQSKCSTMYRRMLQRRVDQLSRRGGDLAIVLSGCCPDRNPGSDWKTLNPLNTLFVAGGFDFKYTEVGSTLCEIMQGCHYKEIAGAGHAVLTEAPMELSTAILGFLSKNSVEEKGTHHSTASMSSDLDEEIREALLNRADVDLQRLDSEQKDISDDPDANHVRSSVKCAKGNAESEDQDTAKIKPSKLNFKRFSIDMTSEDGENKAIFGIGWGDASRKRDSNNKRRKGVLIQLTSEINGQNIVGVGEVAPLPGLHDESLGQSTRQLELIGDFLISSETKDVSSVPTFNASKVLALDGSLSLYTNALTECAAGSPQLLPSVRSGLEMAIISLASQASQLPLMSALSTYSPEGVRAHLSSSRPLQVNGLITRGEKLDSNHPLLEKQIGDSSEEMSIAYSSVKIKVGNSAPEVDVQRIVIHLNSTHADHQKIRLDANRAWDARSAVLFASEFHKVGSNLASRLEFIEEPLQQQIFDGAVEHIQRLEEFYEETGIVYGLDETLADIVEQHQRNFTAISASLRTALFHADGCAAFVLKPALLGIELSMQLARLARVEFGVGAVFSSSFDSGVGLGYTSFLAATSDSLDSPPTALSKTPRKQDSYAHGLGTFPMLVGDTIQPPFASYVSNKGELDTFSLCREFYGLNIDQVKGSSDDIVKARLKAAESGTEKTFSSSTEVSGRQITVQASLPLPFADSTACARFTDLPQQPRWSPWLKTVEYVTSTETEWTLSILGNPFRWRAVSTVSTHPHGISWESISGLRNEGKVWFLPVSDKSCTMSVTVTFIAPKGIDFVFREGSMFEDFLRNKLLKWSLEMFRDVVKADLALERGDVELGDALFGAVEGRATAIETTLSYCNQTMNSDFFQ